MDCDYINPIHFLKSNENRLSICFQFPYTAAISKQKQSLQVIFINTNEMNKSDVIYLLNSDVFIMIFSVYRTLVLKCFNRLENTNTQSYFNLLLFIGFFAEFENKLIESN